MRQLSNNKYRADGVYSVCLFAAMFLARRNETGWCIGKETIDGFARETQNQRTTENHSPERTAELAEICGSTIPYEVDWESFADDVEGVNFLDNLSCH